MKKHHLLLGLLLILPFLGLAQKLTISGQIKDKRGETLPGAGVYLSNYKIATVTNNDGKFVLNNLNPGSYNVLVEMMGYLPFSQKVVISDRSAVIDIVLTENAIQLNEVVIRVDPNREKYITLFKEFFIGKTPNSKKCKLLNPQALIVDFDEKEKVLSVKSTEFLIIENKALGYRLKYMLQRFEYNYNSKIVFYAGLPNFEDLKGSKSTKANWEKSRKLAFYGSSQHFFESLYKGTAQDEGYIINKRMWLPNIDRPADEVIDANIKRLVKAKYGVLREGSIARDSLSYWTSVKQMPKYISTLNRNDVLTDTLVTQQYTDRKTINFSDELYVIYTGERESVDYTDRSGHAITRPLTMPNFQISVVQMVQRPVHFYSNGGIFQSQAFLYEGFWAYEKIADMVPMDYIPTRTN